MTAGGKGAEGDVDLEDKIIKEVRWVVSTFHLVFGMMISGRRVMLILNLGTSCPIASLIRFKTLTVLTLERITSNVKPQTRWAIDDNDDKITATGIRNKGSPRRSKTSGTRSSRWPSQLGADRRGDTQD
jgi:hypothetical protein